MSTAATAGKKRCLYEILCVSREATAEEIRSSYRKLALQLHPDKVASQSHSISPADATSAFQELVHAYEILSDPKERAYYDSHRSQILFSDLSNNLSKKSSFSFPDLDLFSFFSSSAFSGYTDTGRGFYKVYSDVFSKIYERELWFLKEMGLNQDSVLPPPLMGNLESPYAQVMAFYGHWLGFCTVMDFGWADLYDAMAGDSRKARRVMEEENKKARKKAKREYNDSVRGLTAFVKKRDKRVIDMAVKKAKEEEKRKEEERERKKEEARRKAERVRLYEEQEWAKADADEVEQVDNDYDHFGHPIKNKKTADNADTYGGEELYCVVCSKKFKSEKQWKNHEQSKKHRDKVAELREMMLDEEEDNEDVDDHSENNETLLEGDIQERLRVSFDYVPDDEKSDSLVDEPCEELDDDLMFEKKEVLHSEGFDDLKYDKEEDLHSQGFDDLKYDKEEVLHSKRVDQELIIDEEAHVLEAMLSGRKNRKTVNLEQSDNSPSTNPFLDDSDVADFIELVNKKKGRKNKTKRRGGCKEKTEGNYENTKEELQDIEKTSLHSGKEFGTRVGDDHVSGKNQTTKDLKNDKKAPATKVKDLSSKNSSKGKKPKGASKDTGNECGTCGEGFESRNKLFMHLGETGHSMLKSR